MRKPFNTHKQKDWTVYNVEAILYLEIKLDILFKVILNG